MAFRETFPRDDRLKRLRQVIPPPRVARVRVGAGDRLQTGCIAGERQRRQEFDRQRRARPLERLPEVVDAKPAAPFSERDVR